MGGEEEQQERERTETRISKRPPSQRAHEKILRSGAPLTPINFVCIARINAHHLVKVGCKVAPHILATSGYNITPHIL